MASREREARLAKLQEIAILSEETGDIDSALQAMEQIKLIQTQGFGRSPREQRGDLQAQDEEFRRESFLSGVDPQRRILLEGIGDGELAAIAAGNRLMTLGRGVGLVDPASEADRRAIADVQQLNPALFGAAEIGTDIAAFSPGGAIAGAARTVGGKIAGQSAVSALEGGVAARGEGQGLRDQAKQAVVSGVLGGTIDSAVRGVPAVGAAIGSRAKRFVGRETPATTIPVGKRLDETMLAVAPEVDDLKSVAGQIYNEIDELGITLKPIEYDGLNLRLALVANKMGFRPRAHPNVNAVLQDFTDNRGQAVRLSDLDNKRTFARTKVKTNDDGQDAIVQSLIGEIDDYMDGLSSKSFTNPTDVDVSGLYRDARKIWGRAKRGELIQDAAFAAANTPGSFETAMKSQLRKIANDKKLFRKFNEKEQAALLKAVRGSATEDVARELGELGLSEGRYAAISLGAMGGAGFAVGGPAGAAAGALSIPLIGKVSRTLADRLTRKNVAFFDQVVRAGSDGEDIVKAYMANTAKGKRKTSEIMELLIRPGVKTEKLLKSKNRFVRDALFIMQRVDPTDIRRAFGTGAVSAEQQGIADISEGISQLTDEDKEFQPIDLLRQGLEQNRR